MFGVPALCEIGGRGEVSHLEPHRQARAFRRQGLAACLTCFVCRRCVRLEAVFWCPGSIGPFQQTRQIEVGARLLLQMRHLVISQFVPAGHARGHVCGHVGSCVGWRASIIFNATGWVTFADMLEVATVGAASISTRVFWPWAYCRVC